jgi:hypothetical protein
MKSSIKVPGLLWVILFLILGTATQIYAPQIEARTSLTPAIIDMIVAACFGAYKYFNLGTSDLEVALDIIALLRAQLDKARQGTPAQFRGPEDASAVEPVVFEDDIPDRPHKATAWLLG